MSNRDPHFPRPFVLHFLLEATGKDMPLGDPTINGPRYAKSFETVLQAHAWLERHIGDLRISTAWVRDLREGPEPTEAPIGASPWSLAEAIKEAEKGDKAKKDSEIPPVDLSKPDPDDDDDGGGSPMGAPN